MLGFWIDVPYFFLVPSIIDTLIQSLYPGPSLVEKKCDVSTKRVSFSNVVRVVLIPTRAELKKAKLSLWHTPYDYLLAKKSVKEEVDEILEHSSFSSRECMRILYQPKTSCIRVLVVERDLSIRNWIRDQFFDLFGSPNVLFVFVDSGLQAVSKARKNLCFDVVLMRSDIPYSYFDIKRHQLPRLLRKTSGFDSCIFVSFPFIEGTRTCNPMECMRASEKTVSSSRLSEEMGSSLVGWQDIARLLELFRSRSEVDIAVATS